MSDRPGEAGSVVHGEPAGSTGAPAWAHALSAGADPVMVARCLALLVDPAVDAEALRRVLAQRLGAGRPTDAASVAGALVGSRLQDPAGLEVSAEALREVGARVHVVGEPGYPRRLADAWPELGAPLWLAVRSATGRLPEGPAVAVVGTRRPSLDGLRTARALGRLLARHRVTVISGLARGIDQEAHRGALDAGGATAAVLGTGLDVDYPAKDGALRAAVADAGGLATELPLGAPPHARHFLARNRIISGLADATVVVEGRARSGALQTARMAASQGREVFAVPGSLHQPTARGPLDLVRDGARCVTQLDDVLEAVEPQRLLLPPPEERDATERRDRDGSEMPGKAAAAEPSPDAVAVKALLGAVPASTGALADAAGLSVSATMAAVSELLARGVAVRTPRGLVRA